MNAERWEQVQTLFKEILELDHDSRVTRLNEVKDLDVELYRELDSLLAADSDHSSILDGFALDSIDISGLLSMEGTKIGPFEIDRLIGSGGMGSVFLARRVKGGFEQQVALKLIKFGMDSERLLRRFESERSILARLEHPHIARLVDGGLTDDGRPWFAMEYVEGETLLAYSRRLNLPLKQRLKLFLDVSNAVQYAHRNLIVHRDLKPGNILVTEDGSRANIKLLDFGIAQIMEEAEQAGEEAMTKAYASPEQQEGDPTTTLSDIYSLGVMLQELITGCHPDPQYQNEGCEPEPLDRELAAICRKAMSRDPVDRFETVSEMEEEIRSWLEKRPVASYSEQPLYRLGKLTVRNRMAVGTAVLSVIAILMLVLFYTLELKQEKERAEAEAARAARISSVLGNSFLAIDPMQNGGDELTARNMVDMSTAFINNELRSDPQTRSELLAIMADIYANLVAYDVADSVSLKALELRKSIEDTTSFAYINMLAKRSVILDRAGDFDQAKALIEEAVNLANEYLPRTSLEFASVQLDYIYNLDGAGDYDKIDSLLTMVAPVFERNREEAGQDYEHYLFYQGLNHRRLGTYEQAEKYLLESLELSRERYPGAHEDIASTLNHISSLYQNMGDYEKAIPYAIDSYEMRKEIFGSNHLNTMASHANMARAYSGAGRLEEAAETYSDVIAIFREEYGNENFYIAGLLQSYGSVFIRMEEYERAETIIREAVQHSERLLPEDHLRQAYPLQGLANALMGQEEYEEALPYIEQAFAIRDEQLPDDNPLLNSTRHALGRCLWQLDRREEAEPHLRRALAFYNTDPERYQEEIEEIGELGFQD